MLQFYIHVSMHSCFIAQTNTKTDRHTGIHTVDTGTFYIRDNKLKL